MTDNPITEAFAAVVAGIVTGALLPAFNDVFEALEAPLLFKIMMSLIPIAEFIAGLNEALVFGILYSTSLIAFGLLLDEWSSVIMGIIALGAHIAGIFIKLSS